MKHNKWNIAGRLLTLTLILVFVFSLTVSGSDDVYLIMNAEFVELTYNESFDFNVKVKGLSCCAVTWHLDDEEYLSVDNNGIVSVKDNIVDSGLGEETYTITAYSVMGDYSVSAKILVSEPPKGAVNIDQIKSFNTPVAFSIADKFVDIHPSQTFDFNVKMNGLSNYDILWTIEENQFLTIDRNGLVTFKDTFPRGEIGEQTLTITAQSDTGEFYDTATIMLSEVPQAPIKIRKVIPRLYNTDYNPW